MLSLRWVVVSLVQLCILLAVVGGHAKDTEEQRPILRTKRIIRKGFQVCDKGKECVPKLEYCNAILGTTMFGWQSCGFTHHLSWKLQSFCCPISQVSSTWRERKKNVDGEISDVIEILEKAFKPRISPSREALVLFFNKYLEEPANSINKPLQKEPLKPTINPLQEEELNPTINPLQEEEEEMEPTINPLLEEVLEPTINPLQVNGLSSTINPTQEEILTSTINPIQDEPLTSTTNPVQEEIPNSTINPTQEEILTSTINPIQDEPLTSTTDPTQEEILTSTINPIQDEPLTSTTDPLQDEIPNSTINPVQEETLNSTIKRLNFTEEPECGVNNVSMVQKELDPNSTADNWPWMAVLLQERNYVQFCGGVLLNLQFVLTAAHCFTRNSIDKIIVRLGEYDFSTKNDTQYIDYRILDVIKHPEFDAHTQKNDIALIKLEKPTEYTAYIRPICLPAEDGPVHGNIAIVIGFGQTAYGGSLSDVLREVTVPIWHEIECKKTFTHRVFKTNICAAAYGGGRDSCIGDSGGPLLIQREDGRWANVGIVSWGMNCGLPGIPGVYTLVPSYLKWIIENSRM